MDGSSRKNKWLEQKKNIRNFLIGSYGGGDSQKIASSLLQIPINPKETEYLKQHLTDLKTESLLQSLYFIESYNNVLEDKKIAKISEELPDVSINEWDWTHVLHVSGCLEGKMNLMFHGWLLHDEIYKDDRLGCTKWPLIGLFQNCGINPASKDEDTFDGNINQSTVINKVRPADQHTHYVEEYIDLDGFLMDLSDFHFGSDMAQFVVDLSDNNDNNNNNLDFSYSWVVAIDSENKRGQISLLIMIHPGHEDNFNSFLLDLEKNLNSNNNNKQDEDEDKDEDNNDNDSNNDNNNNKESMNNYTSNVTFKQFISAFVEKFGSDDNQAFSHLSQFK